MKILIGCLKALSKFTETQYAGIQSQITKSIFIKVINKKKIGARILSNVPCPVSKGSNVETGSFNSIKQICVHVYVEIYMRQKDKTQEKMKKLMFKKKSSNSSINKETYRKI